MANIITSEAVKTFMQGANQAELKTAVGLGGVDNTSDAAKNEAEVTLTNKIISGASNTLTVRAANDITGLLPVANGGTGTATPAIVAGTNVTVTGTWPNQTISAGAASYSTQASSYTLVLADAFKAVTINNGSANTLTVPANASVAFLVGTRISSYQLGAGLTTIVAAGGVTINSRDGALVSAGQYAGWMLEKISTNSWIATGDLVT